MLISFGVLDIHFNHFCRSTFCLYFGCDFKVAFTIHYTVHFATDLKVIFVRYEIVQLRSDFNAKL